MPKGIFAATCVGVNYLLPNITRKVAMKRLPGSEVGCDFPSPKPQNETLSKWIWGWEEPLKPFPQVQEWCVFPSALHAVGYVTDLFAGSFSICLGLVQPADPQFHAIMVCL